MEASAPPPPSVALAGRVQRPGSDAGVAGAIVVVELGGLGRVAPDQLAADGGPTATIAVDPFIRYGAVTSSTGAFAFSVPAGAAGLHTLAPPYLEKLQTVATSSPSVVSLQPLSLVEAGVRSRPVASGLSANLGPQETAVSPLSAITFAVNVAAGQVQDPLSSDVFLLQPDTGWAGALAPPTPAVPGGPYPDGVYNRVIEAPGAPGVYKYTVVAASTNGIPSVPVSIFVTVTSSGAPPVPDAGDLDAAYFDAAGLPDGRY